MKGQNGSARGYRRSGRALAAALGCFIYAADEPGVHLGAHVQADATMGERRTLSSLSLSLVFHIHGMKSLVSVLSMNDFERRRS